MKIKKGYKRWVFAYFILGMVWAWGLTVMVLVMLGYNKDVAEVYTKEVETVSMEVFPASPIIPVEIYKLEREETK
jgi:hypothetical protein